MKVIACLIVFFMGIHFGFSQVETINNFYEQFKEKEKITDVKLQGWLLKIASKYADDESSKNILDKISYLRVLIMEEGNLVQPGEYKKLIKSLQKEQFDELLQLKEKDQRIEFLIRQNEEMITDAIILVNGSDSFILLSLEGALKFSDLNDLNIEVEGAEHFKKLPDDRKKIPQA